MKKFFFILSVLLIYSTAFAFDPGDACYSSGEKTADAVILRGPGYFQQLMIMPDGTNAVTVSIYDNTATSGTEIVPTLTFAGNGGAQATPPIWVHVTNGITVDITTAGTVGYVVYYRGR